MVIRVALLAAVGVLATACGDTCGRGRCANGTCTSVLGRAVTLMTWSSWEGERYPRTDNEFWCEIECPAEKSCAISPGTESPRTCLQDPANDGVIVCATEQPVPIEFLHRGRQVPVSTLEGSSGNVCAPFSSYRVVNSSGQAVATCQPDQPCAIPSVASGAQVPIRLRYDNVMNVQLSELAPARLTPPFPAEGRRLRIYSAVKCAELPE